MDGAPSRNAVRAVPLAERSLAPDVARGSMLLLIALANVHLYLRGTPLGPRGYPIPDGALDRVVTAAQLTLVDGRAYPLFSLLFGYGIVQLTRRRVRAGDTPQAVRRLVRRRGWWMLLIGGAHALLLFSGDIIGAYGLVAVLFAGVLVRQRRGRGVLIGVGLVLLAPLGLLLGGVDGTGATAVMPSGAQGSYLLSLGLRAPEWVVGLLLAPFAVAVTVAIGAWAAERGLLDEPGRHLPLLRRTAAAGLGLAVAGGLPTGLAAAGVWEPAAGWTAGAVASAHLVTGYAGGLGYAALFGLVAARAAGRPAGGRGPVLRVLAAGGQRSMSCYLGQSVVFCALLPAWALGLGDDLGVAAVSGLAVLTWAVLLAGAGVLARAGRRGPAEVLLRRLTYGR
ncbi:DUF418 domain-containing protein [Kineococcus sp. NUM-3379]